MTVWLYILLYAICWWYPDAMSEISRAWQAACTLHLLSCSNLIQTFWITSSSLSFWLVPCRCFSVVKQCCFLVLLKCWKRLSPISFFWSLPHLASPSDGSSWRPFLPFAKYLTSQNNGATWHNLKTTLTQSILRWRGFHVTVLAAACS